jgi:ribosomal-protein-alanine N-acetyltransferase
MQNTYFTNRLSLQKINLNDAAFILELVNTPKWIEFIGNRNVHSPKDAENYIHKILLGKNTQYWVVKLKESYTAIGVITLLKRDYLSEPDIGFAFLNQYKKQGYALEAAAEIIKHALFTYKTVSAITLAHNADSISLLEKLDFIFKSELNIEGEKLLHYQIDLSLTH